MIEQATVYGAYKPTNIGWQHLVAARDYQKGGQNGFHVAHPLCMKVGQRPAGYGQFYLPPVGTSMHLGHNKAESKTCRYTPRNQQNNNGFYAKTTPAQYYLFISIRGFDQSFNHSFPSYFKGFPAFHIGTANNWALLAQKSQRRPWSFVAQLRFSQYTLKSQQESSRLRVSSAGIDQAMSRRVFRTKRCWNIQPNLWVYL